MTATQIITVISILEAMTPTLQLLAQGVRGLTDKEVNVEDMTIGELMELKRELEQTHPDNWPDFGFQTPQGGQK